AAPQGADTFAADSRATKVEVAFAADAALSGLPAIQWLCGTLLPMRDEWPSGLRNDQSFVVTLAAGGLAIAPNSVPLPDGALYAGSIEYAPGKRVLCTCAPDGTEDWFVPKDVRPPRSWLALLQLLRALECDRFRTVDLGVAVGHLLGGTAVGDAGRDSIQIGASLCADVTWKAWWNSEYLRVRGRSDGGLLLPATLLVLARERGNGAPTPLPMRAFIARDGDREEAVRQMARGERSDDRVALLAMLHGNDELRLTAIDSLVRLGAAADLPRIVAAASPELPLTTVAAADAVEALWPRASEATRSKTRSALAASSTAALRNLDPNRIREPLRGPIPGITEHWRILVGLFLLATCLFGLWLRERARSLSY
ncbi:MAG: hypothetical protein KDE27_06020, partial [Planctomycetes bacterium]|nr:hypothetical protein [Planctomycetota bacterium]